MDGVNSRVPQAYGYAVCFITVVVMLFSIKGVVDAAFDLSDPLRADAGGRPITNFELYKNANRTAIAPKDQNGPTPPSTAPVRSKADTLSDADLRKLYDAEREAAIGNARFRAIRSLVGNLLLITLAAVLFTIHWRWLRRRDVLPATA
ncbi:MAG: hypothetical protein QOK07_566 [Gemmatimonadaceae bacterium]|jgi:hypothetical protein|nr:hypothetical protein [Gemmatimonadaceae bacterium]